MREVMLRLVPNGLGELGFGGIDDWMVCEGRGLWPLEVIDVVVVSLVTSPGLIATMVTSLVKSVTVTNGLPFDRPDYISHDTFTLHYYCSQYLIYSDKVSKIQTAASIKLEEF